MTRSGSEGQSQVSQVRTSKLKPWSGNVHVDFRLLDPVPSLQPITFLSDCYHDPHLLVTSPVRSSGLQ